MSGSDGGGSGGGVNPKRGDVGTGPHPRPAEPSFAEILGRVPTWAKIGAVIVGVLLVFAMIRHAFVDDDRTAPTATRTAPTSSHDPRPTMVSNGDAHKIDDCFLCSTKPGTWETAGADSSGVCWWSRSTDLTGDPDSVLEVGQAGPGERVRVAVTLGEYFVSDGCLTWRFIG